MIGSSQWLLYRHVFFITGPFAIFQNIPCDSTSRLCTHWSLSLKVSSDFVGQSKSHLKVPILWGLFWYMIFLSLPGTCNYLWNNLVSIWCTHWIASRGTEIQCDCVPISRTSHRYRGAQWQGIGNVLCLNLRDTGAQRTTLESLLRFKPCGRNGKIWELKVGTLGHWVCNLETKKR